MGEPRKRLGQIVIRTGAAFLLAGFFPSAARAQADCFDLAVIATSPRYAWGESERPSSEREIIINTPVKITFDVVEPVAGMYRRDQIVANGALHVEFTSKAKWFLLFLQRTDDGGYWIRDIELWIVKDRRGDFVIPVAAPLSEDELSPHAFMPRGYEALLRDSRYRPSDAWWLARQEPIPSWSSRKGDTIVADRSLPVKDVVKALEDRRCAAR